MLLDTAESIRSVLCKVSKILNLCKSSVINKESLRDDCDDIIKQICDIHSRLMHSVSEVDTDIFPKTIPYTNLLHLQATNKIALNESEQQLDEILQS